MIDYFFLTTFFVFKLFFRPVGIIRASCSHTANTETCGMRASVTFEPLLTRPRKRSDHVLTRLRSSRGSSASCPFYRTRSTLKRKRFLANFSSFIRTVLAVAINVADARKKRSTLRFYIMKANKTPFRFRGLVMGSNDLR